MHDVDLLLLDETAHAPGRTPRPDGVGGGSRPTGEGFDLGLWFPRCHLVAGLAEQRGLVAHDPVLARRVARSIPVVQHQDAHATVSIGATAPANNSGAENGAPEWCA